MPKDKPRFVSIVPNSPVVIDLLQLENGNELARIQGRIDRVPVGTYDKIRVHYRDVKVVLQDGSVLRFHPTAYSKFDIRFRAGHELVIPPVADTTKPGDWTKYFRVKIRSRGDQDQDPGLGEMVEGVQGHPPAADLRGGHTPGP